MSNRMMRAMPYALALCVVGVAAFLLAGSFSFGGKAEANRSEVDISSRMSLLNEKARAAKSGDEVAVRQLVDEVFSETRLPSTPPSAEDGLKDRVLRAEISYRQGRREGIQETALVKAINDLTDKLGAPDYARTHTGQVRTIRVGFMPLLPSLITQEPARTEKMGKATGEALPAMSPMEAVYVGRVLINQKLYNDKFLTTPTEWADNMRSMKKERAEGRSNNQRTEANTTRSRTQYEIQRKAPSARQEEILNLLKNRAEAMTKDDVLSLAHSTLDALGIER